MRRIDELQDIDLYDAEGVFTYLKILNDICRSVSNEVEYSSEALKIALGTTGGLLGALDMEARIRARRTTAPLRRVAEASQFCAIQVVKTGVLFKQNYSDELQKRERRPAKEFRF